MGQRVILHVGAMKSGTSYLQALLYANRPMLAERGVLVPGRTWSDQVRAVQDVLGMASERTGDISGCWDGLVEEVAAYDGTAVVSMEFLGAAPKAVSPGGRCAESMRFRACAVQRLTPMRRSMRRSARSRDCWRDRRRARSSSAPLGGRTPIVPSVRTANEGCHLRPLLLGEPARCLDHDQFRVCREFAQRQGWKIEREYSDHAMSGATLLRPGFQAMMAEALRNNVDIVMAEALDRFSRDQEDTAALFKRLTFAGVNIVTMAEGDITHLHIGLKGTMNALFLEELADKTRRGLRGRIELGKAGGGVSYGYLKDPDTGKRVARPNPRSEWITKDVPELRILDDELWQAVQTRYAGVQRKWKSAEEGKRFNQFRRPKYLFSGLTKCGECGAGFVVYSREQLGCFGTLDRGRCTNKLTISRLEVEERVLSALQDKLMRKDFFEEFCREFAKEMNRLRMEQRAGQTSAKRELVQLEARRKKIVESIIEGVRGRDVKDELIAIGNRRDELEAQLKTADEPPPLLHPSMADLYRSKVEELAAALQREDTRLEASEMLRGLIDSIVLMPDGCQLRIELRGNLAAMLTAAQQTKRSPETGDLHVPIQLVAGARNQHYLQLWRPAA